MQGTDSKSEPGQPGPNSGLRNVTRGKKISWRMSMACPYGRHGRGDGHGELNVKIHLNVGKILRSNSLKAAKELTGSRAHSTELQSFVVVVVVDKINCAELHSAEEVAASPASCPCPAVPQGDGLEL